MRHVAVLAAAAVMLTAIAVPAQGFHGEKPLEGGSGGIDAYCISFVSPADCGWSVGAKDTAKIYRVLQMVLYDSDGIVIESVEDWGTGQLLVESDYASEMHVVTVYLYKVDKELNPSKLLDRVVCTYEDQLCRTRTW